MKTYDWKSNEGGDDTARVAYSTTTNKDTDTNTIEMLESTYPNESTTGEECCVGEKGGGKN